MKKFLTVGTDEIREDLFVSVMDSYKGNDIKPKGGLWLTEFETNFSNYNVWLDFILRNKRNMYIFFYKRNGNNPFVKPCSVITLKEDANIFIIDSKEKYDFLVSSFPDDRGQLSFEKMSNLYDGVFVNVSKLRYKMDYCDFEKFDKFDVDSLCLFNLNCIDYYYSGTVEVEPFDYEFCYDGCHPDYSIKWNLEKKYVIGKGKIRG